MPGHGSFMLSLKARTGLEMELTPRGFYTDLTKAYPGIYIGRLSWRM